MSSNPHDPIAVLVLGMHRSGTSPLAGVLHRIGVHPGGDLASLHDRLLAALGSAWDDPRPLPREALFSEAAKPLRAELLGTLRRDVAGRPLWGVTDPRLCRLVPLWLSLLQELGASPRFVLVARRPQEVAASLARRDGMPAEHAQLLWLEHCLAAERDTRGHPRAFVTYDGLLTDWRAEMVRVGRCLRFDWRETAAKAAPEAETFLDSKLRHHHIQESVEDGLHPWLRATWTIWRDATTGGDPGPALSAIRDRWESSGRLFWPFATRVSSALGNGDARIRAPRVRETSPSSPSLAADAASATAHPGPARLTRRPGTTIARSYERPAGSPRVSIIVPLFNRAELTRKCLESLAAHTPAGLFELILVDNGSTDGTADVLRRLEGNVKVVVNERNLGFAAACNQGAEMASTDNLLFLNNDVEAKPAWLEPLIALFDADPGVAAAGSRLLFPDGAVQHAGMALLQNTAAPLPLRAFPLYRGEPGSLVDANVRSEVQVLTGACLLVRRGVFESVGGFDVRYWNGCEDADLCLKIGTKGWTLVYEPASCLVHHDPRSGAKGYAGVSGNEARLSSRWLGKVDPDMIEEADGTLRRSAARRIRAYELPQRAEGGYRHPATAGARAVQDPAGGASIPA